MVLLAGWRLSMEEALGWGWKAVIHSEDLENLMATWLGLLASGEHRRVRPELICA